MGEHLFARYLDALLPLLTLPAGVTIDDSLAEPFQIVAHRLYVWPRRLAVQQMNLEAEDAGFFDDSIMHLRILLTLPAKGEARVKKADRQVSLDLDRYTRQLVKDLWANRVYPIGSGALWHHLIIENVVPDAVRSIATRGYGLDVQLLLSPMGEDIAWGSGS